MQKGRSIEALAERVAALQARKHDYQAPCAGLGFDEEARVRITGIDTAFTPTQHFDRQLGLHVGIPAPYYRRMREEAPGLLAQNVNRWLHGTREARETKRLVRTFDPETRGQPGAARAFLSSRFGIFDHEDTLAAVMPALHTRDDLEVVSCEITERKLYLHCRFGRLQTEVRVGDTVQLGVIVSNSEVGFGSIAVQPWIYRLVCLNGMITGSKFSRAHLGGTLASSDEVAHIAQDDTRAAYIEAVRKLLRDALVKVLSPEGLEDAVAPLRAAASENVAGSPEVVIRNVTRRLEMTEAECGAALRALIDGGDLTRWGYANAITRVANGDGVTYDRAVELEGAGHKVIEMQARDWREVAEEPRKAA